jgi:hypothetical protein
MKNLQLITGFHKQEAVIKEDFTYDNGFKYSKTFRYFLFLTVVYAIFEILFSIFLKIIHFN